MLVAMARDIRVLLVKLADRLDNMRTLQHMKPESQERIATETMEIYAPLAGRLGINWLKAELEDLSFRYLHPDAHEDLVNTIARHDKDLDTYVDKVTREITTMMASRGFSLEVSGRRKHYYSVYRKMKRTGIEFEQVQDFIAFPRGHGERRRLLRRARRRAQHVDAGSWSFQRLYRAAEAEYVPVAAHHGHRARVAANGDSDPHPRDESDRRARHCGALAVQTADRWPRQTGCGELRVAAPAHGVPARRG